MKKAKQFSSVFAALCRLHRLDRLLGDGRWHRVNDIAVTEEVCAKTIYRALDFLRDQLGWRIDSGNNGVKLVMRDRKLIDMGRPL